MALSAAKTPADPAAPSGRSVVRWAALGIVAAGTIWLAWQIVVIAVSDYFAISYPEVALAWDPGHSEALNQIAERQWALLPDQVSKPELADIAQRIMLNDPLNGVSLRIFASLREAADDDVGAESLMRLAAARTRRDQSAQIWLADDELLKQNYAAGLEHVDALLRVQPRLGDTLFPVLAELAKQPASREALIAALQKDPPWRQGFLLALSVGGKELSGLASFYSDLQKAPVPLRPEELRPYLEALIESGEASLAHAIWLDTLGEDRPATPGIYNGDFELPISGMPFDWILEKVRGAQAKIVSYAAGDHALLVEFYNTQVPFQHVSEVLFLNPGFYSFTGKVKADALQNDRGLQWTLSCASGAKDRIAETERTRGTVAWSTFEVHFRVPAKEGCQAQLLRLELPARVPSEQQASGAIWFDSLQIAPLAPPS